jgi:hypothetical protein
MCGCGKKKQVTQTYVPQFRQVLVKDRLGKVMVKKVAIPPRRRMPKKNMGKKIVPNIAPKLIEDEINAILPSGQM